MILLHTVENKCSKICRVNPESLEWGAVTLFCVSWMGGITYRGYRVPPRMVTSTLQYGWTAWPSSLALMERTTLVRRKDSSFGNWVGRDHVIQPGGWEACTVLSKGIADGPLPVVLNG